MGKIRHLATAAAWLGGLGTAAWSLVRLGRLPWLRVDWNDPQRWLTTSELEVVLAALARLTGLVIVGWLAASSLGYALARLAGIRRQPLRWLSIGPIRRAVDTALAGSLLLSTFVPGAAAASAPQTTTNDDVASEVVDPAYVPWPAGPGNDNEGSGNETVAEAPPQEGSVSPVSTDAETVVVVPGDHLWRLSEQKLEAALGRSPTDAEVAPYWARVIDVNRPVLISGDPDLIFPGEEIVLPEVNPRS